MKLVINLLVVATAQAMAEALALGRKAGLGWHLLLDTIAQSTIASPWLKVKAGLMKQRDFTPTMTTRLILKDIDLMLAAAQASGVQMPVTSATRQVMQAAIDAGYGERGLHGDHQARRETVRPVLGNGGLTSGPGRAHGRSRCTSPAQRRGDRRLARRADRGQPVSPDGLGYPCVRTDHWRARRAGRRYHDPARVGRGVPGRRRGRGALRNRASRENRAGRLGPNRGAARLFLR